MSPVVILLVLFAVTLIMGVPFVWSLTFSCLVTMCLVGNFPMMTLMQKMYNGGARYTLLAIFFFMLAGAIMQHGGISSRLVNFSKALLGHVSGGLSIVVLAVCMMFAALSGSSIATTAAIGGMLYPELVKAKYPKGYSAALPVAGGTLGIIIPPSIVFVVYGAITGTSISKLLLSGVVPGIMAGLFMILYAWIYARKNKIAKSNEFSWKNLAVATKDATWALLMPIIILGGIYLGVFTPTEAAGVAVVYALFVSMFIYNNLKFKELWDVFVNTGLTSATVLVMVVMASAFGRLLTLERVPVEVANFITSLSSNPIIVIFLINIMLLIVGMFMETIASIIILTPILLPVATAVGIDPIHFGVILVVNLAIGFCTPPLGANLFIATGVANVSLEKLIKQIIPFLISMFVMLFIVTYVPSLSLFLPSLME